MKTIKIEPFSETALTILISIVTLLLQLISFATTWSGSRIYLEGVFPYASLFFAIAIQATAYFFSNSLRTKVSALKILAILAAICCSTYYSYIGIYNSVNSPTKFLQERYVQINEELNGIYESSLEENIGIAKETINDIASTITAEYIMLSETSKNTQACRQELAEGGKSYVTGMQAPKQSSYENYEDYVTAYNAYIAGMSEGNHVETEAGRESILTSYGFSSIEELQTVEAENAALFNALITTLGETQDDAPVSKIVFDISTSLTTALDEAMTGQEFDSIDNVNLNRFVQAAKLCGYQEASASDVINIAKQAAKVTKEPLLQEYSLLVSSLEGGTVTAANTMELKSTLDSEILSALLKINSILQPKDQISYSDERYMITDLYLIPLRALQDSSTRMTALFCLGIAALIDQLSVLFAISLRKRKPIWKRRTLLLCNMEDYMPQIYAALPSIMQPGKALSDFLTCFVPSPETEGDGYIMRAYISTLTSYYQLVALLCQLNLAKLIPGDFLEDSSMTEKEILLLKARFVLWANSVIYKDNQEMQEVSA